MVFQEVVTVKEGIMEDFQKNVEMFATEHLHTEKEARFIIEGSGMSTHSSFLGLYDITVPLKFHSLYL